MQWSFDNQAPESEAVQAEREIFEDLMRSEAEWEYENRFTPAASEAEAHLEWHRNAGVPLGTPGCPWDACHDDDGYDAYQAEIAAETPVSPSQGTVRFKRLKSGAWGLTGPDDLLQPGTVVAVAKRGGTSSTVTVGRVLWSGDGKAICTIAR